MSRYYATVFATNEIQYNTVTTDLKDEIRHCIHFVVSCDWADGGKMRNTKMWLKTSKELLNCNPVLL